MQRIMLGLLVMLLASTALAEEDKRLSAEVLWQIDRLGAPVISPDGRQVVVPVTAYELEDDDSQTRLWLLWADGEKPGRALTIPDATASSPVFSPDGRRLAFISTRGDDEAGQIHLLPMDGPGEAVRLGDVPTGVSSLKWVGEHIYFISSVWPEKSFDEMAEHLEAQKERKVSAQVWTEMPYADFDRWLDEDRENHLYRIPAGGGEAEALTLATGLALSSSADASDFDIAADESRLAFVADSSREGIYPDPDLYLLVDGDDQARNLTQGNKAPDSRPMFSPDGRLLAFSRQHIPGFYGDQRKLMLHEMATGRTRLVHGDWDRSADGLVWSPDSAGLFGAIDDAGTRRVYFLPISTSEPVAITDASDYDSLAIADDGTLIGRNHSFVYPPRVVHIEPETGAARRLESFNDELLAEVETGRYESVTYSGADGAEIQMWVHYPPGFDPDREYPLLLLIHGGPHGAITDGFHFRWNAQTFASWGYVTAWHNFHGSSGFGQKFADSINPDWMTKPYADTIAAADWFMQKPWIDADRMVAGGGSYGGYLSTVLLGREHPFQALMIHAAVYDLYAQSSADFAVHDQRFGPYWENPALYKAISPHYFAGQFDTPSLIIHGQKDLRVPVGQAFELFRTLQTRGVESKLIYYPDENHWVLKPNNSLHWYAQVRDWFERFAEPGPREPASAETRTDDQAEPDSEVQADPQADADAQTDAEAAPSGARAASTP
ncbi:MAG: S9 family peptidase [Wenzhouxiangellaceae bacterium]|nr:S9 family peptidase [Wenzhouxiangellaceae bacterium]